jgi:hypothetical protein
MEKCIATVLLSYFCVLLLSPEFILVLSQENGMCNVTQYKSCDELLPGQYRCDETLQIDPDTQSVVGCKESHTVEGILSLIQQPQNTLIPI